MLQIRVSLPDFTNGVSFIDPVIMENADNISLIKTINSSDESIAFDIPLNDTKLPYINYLRWWECWDTDTNARLNYGPIHGIERNSGETKRVSGPGRSAVLLDFYKSVQTFYYPISKLLDDLRYENFISEPRTSTIINVNTDSPYYGLSKRSKDRAIDEDTGYIAIGRDVPDRGTKKTDSMWAGVGKADWITVDLGDTYTISKAKVLLPWWGGATINNDRTFDWRILTATDVDGPYTEQYSYIHGVDGITIAPEEGGQYFYWSESGFENNQETISDYPLDFRYLKIDILNTYARYNIITVDSVTGHTDDWDWECGGSNIFRGDSRPSPSVSTGDLIDKGQIVPSSDCYASVVEVGIYKKIIGRDEITDLAYHQIDGTNRQVTFYHVPDASETFAAGSDRKFEPGGFFRRVNFTTSSDVTVEDEYNLVLYSGGSGTIICPAYTKFLLFKGSGDAQVTYADTWPSVLDAYSYSGSYSSTTIPNDYFTVDFRGVSFKWFATVPVDKTPGSVSIELRNKDSYGVWGAWQVLEPYFTLPSDVAGEKIWEITYESGILQGDTSYQIKVTNLDGNFVSLDSLAGYWSATYTEYNEDDNRISIKHPNIIDQLYDQKFGNGSIYKFNEKNASLSLQAYFTFTGDRLIIFSRKGSGYGSFKVYGLPDVPGADADGGYRVNLDHPHDIVQAVVFDTNELYDDNGLSWDRRRITIDKIGGTSDIWLEGIGAHETSGLSVKFLNTAHLDILKSTAEALQMEWDVTEAGIDVKPRLGVDTNEIFAEGRGVTIKIGDVTDVQQVATMLIGSGADIDGLPLTTVVEDRKTRRIIGRTIQRLYDVRSVGDYFTLIGASRAELLRRRQPEKRITLQATDLKSVTYGDSFIVKHPDLEQRVRAITITRTQSSSAGTTYEVACEVWPKII